MTVEMSSVNYFIDAYAILGVERDARITDINAAYKRLALKLHPDKAGNSDDTVEQFQKVYFQSQEQSLCIFAMTNRQSPTGSRCHRDSS